VAVNTVDKLQFSSFIFAVLLSVASSSTFYILLNQYKRFLGYHDFSIFQMAIGYQIKLLQVYLLTPMDHATLLSAKSTISHCPLSLITRQRASVDSKLLNRPRNAGYYHIFEQ